MIEAARSSAALGAYREGLDGLASVREVATGSELAALLSLRADLLMAEADPGTVDAYREALAAVSDPVERSKLRARLARAATFAGDLDTAAAALEGLTPDGSPDDATLLMARGCLAFYQGDLDTAAEAAAEARRRVILGVPQEWQMFDLVSLQGLVAHTRGQWFERLDFELRRGVSRPGMAARIFDSHLCVAEYLLYGPTPYPEIVSMATELRDTAERAGVLRAVAFATTLRGEAAYLMGDLELAAGELRESSDLHHDIGSTAGEAHSLQRLAEVQLALGNRTEANRLLIRALPLARFSSIALHIIVRVYGTLIEAAARRRSRPGGRRPRGGDHGRGRPLRVLLDHVRRAGRQGLCRRRRPPRGPPAPADGREVGPVVEGNLLARLADGDQGPDRPGRARPRRRRALLGCTQPNCSRHPGSRWTPVAAASAKPTPHRSRR